MNTLQISGTITTDPCPSIDDTFTALLEVPDVDRPGNVERHDVRFASRPHSIFQGCLVMIAGALRCSLETPRNTEIRVSNYAVLSDC